MKLLQQFIQNAIDRPDELYLKDDSSELTYQEIIYKIEHLRYLLREKSIIKGSKIIILSGNDNSYVVALISIFLEGCIAVPISQESKGTEVQAIIEESQSQVIIGPLSFFSKITTNEFNPIKDSFISRESFMINQQSVFSYDGLLKNFLEFNGNDIRLILFTSGSEGIPKGVCLSDQTISFTIDLCTNYFWNIKKTDNILMIAPAQTIFGITMTLVSILSGSRLRLVNSFNPQTFITTLIEDKITFFAGVPTLAELMLKLKDRIPKSTLHLKKILMAGAPLPESTEKSVENEFDIKIITGYGMTEGVPMAFRNEFETEYPSQTVGRIAPGCELKIVDDYDLVAGSNIEGEILVKGNQIFSGYIKNGESDHSCFENGWFKTGDIGRIDSQGYLFITGRKSDMIKRSGYRVFPAEIENAIKKIDGIFECCVIGIIDKSRGEKIIAFIACKEKLNEKGILKELKQSLSTHKIPNEVIILHELPKTIAGKTDKLLLKEKYLNLKN